MIPWLISQQFQVRFPYIYYRRKWVVDMCVGTEVWKVEWGEGCACCCSS